LKYFLLKRSKRGYFSARMNRLLWITDEMSAKIWRPNLSIPDNLSKLDLFSKEMLDQ
jgi:hypothetical protein